MVVDAGRFLRRAPPRERWHAGGGGVDGGQRGRGQPESRRGAEPVDLPATVIGQRLGAAGKHPDHPAAKAGDTAAAVRLIQDVLSDDAVEQVRKAIGSERPTIVPVLAVEATGHNKIPAVAATALGQRLGLPVDAGIYQKAKRTALDGLGRIFQQPEFDGAVQPGKAYFLVDDTLTQGGTMAALASHIQQNGGRVVGSFALTGKLYSATLRLSPKPFLNCEPAMAMSNKNSAKPLAAASTRSQNRKGVISPAMTRLTPSETESLLNDMRESMKVADELLKTASPLGSDTDDKARPPRGFLLGPWNRVRPRRLQARRRCSPARSASPGEARRSSGPANRCRTSSGSYAISSSARSAHGQSRSPSRRAWRSCPIAGRPSWCRGFSTSSRRSRGSAPRPTCRRACPAPTARRNTWCAMVP